MASFLIFLQKLRKEAVAPLFFFLFLSSQFGGRHSWGSNQCCSLKKTAAVVGDISTLGQPWAVVVWLK